MADLDHVARGADLERAGAAEHHLLGDDRGRAAPRHLGDRLFGDRHLGDRLGNRLFGDRLGGGATAGVHRQRRCRGDGDIRDGAVEGALVAGAAGLAGPADGADLQVFAIVLQRHVEGGGADQRAVQPGRDLAVAELDLQIIVGMGGDIGLQDHVAAAILEADAQAAIGDIDGEVIAAAAVAGGILGQDAGPAADRVGIEAERDDARLQRHRVVMADLDHVARGADLERAGAAEHHLLGDDRGRAAPRHLGDRLFGDRLFDDRLGGGLFGDRLRYRLAAAIGAVQPGAALLQIGQELGGAQARGRQFRAGHRHEGGPVQAAAFEQRVDIGVAAIDEIVADGRGLGLVIEDLHDIAGHRGAGIVIARLLGQPDDGAAAIQRQQRVVLHHDIVLAAIDIDRVDRADRDQVLLDQQVGIAPRRRVGDEDALRRHRAIAGGAVVIHHVLPDGDVMRRRPVGAEHLQEVRVVVALGVRVAVVAVILGLGVEIEIMLDQPVIAVAGDPHQVFLGAVDVIVGDGEVLHVIDQHGVEIAGHVIAVQHQPVDILHIDDAVHRRVLQRDALRGIGPEGIDRDAVETQIRAVVHDHVAELGAARVLGHDRHRGIIRLRDVESAVIAVFQYDGVATVCRIECALQLGLAANRNHRHRSGAPCCGQS